PRPPRPFPTRRSSDLDDRHLVLVAPRHDFRDLFRRLRERDRIGATADAAALRLVCEVLRRRGDDVGRDARTQLALDRCDGAHTTERRSRNYRAVLSCAASIPPRASASSSSPARPLTPTAPMRRPSLNAAIPPLKNVNSGSKLA